MRRILILFICLLQFSVVFSQKVKYGFKAGVNYTLINFSVPEINTEGQQVLIDNKDSFYTEGGHIGVFTEIGINRKLTFETELILSFQNAKNEENKILYQDFLNGRSITTTINRTTDLNTAYINIPFMLKYYFLEKIFVVAGLQMGLLLTSKSEVKGSSSSKSIYNNTEIEQFIDFSTPRQNIKANYRPVSFGLFLGCGYFLRENLFTEVRYNFGVSNDARSIDYDGVLTDQSSKTSGFQFSLGYRF